VIVHFLVQLNFWYPLGLTVVNGKGNADTDNGKCYLRNVMGCINFFLEQRKN